jgi:thymidylate synthase (FAD)
MDVKLLYSTPNPEKAIAVAARVCYSAVGAADLMKEMNEISVQRILKTIITSGHFAALEHASYTFGIDGVSRACTHQLVRHRLASYNQQSQRYVAHEKKPVFIVPPSVCFDEAFDRYSATLHQCWQCYQDLVALGVSAEDARYILPNATSSNIVATMNIRELLHFFDLRCCNRAQWEIRTLANTMLEIVKPTAPYIFMDAGAPCRRGNCPEGKMSCKNPYPRAPRR